MLPPWQTCFFLLRHQIHQWFRFSFDFLISSLDLWTISLQLRNIYFSNLTFLCQFLTCSIAFIRVSVFVCLQKSSNTHHKNNKCSPNLTPSNYIWNILLVREQRIANKIEEKYSSLVTQNYLFGKSLSDNVSGYPEIRNLHSYNMSTNMWDLFHIVYRKWTSKYC